VGLGVLGGLDRSCADGGGLRVAVGWAGWVGRGRQVGRSACGCAPAFGRAVGPKAGGFMARLKPCPFDGVGGGCLAYGRAGSMADMDDEHAIRSTVHAVEDSVDVGLVAVEQEAEF
jgi:hypothetical protein